MQTVTLSYAVSCVVSKESYFSFFFFEHGNIISKQPYRTYKTLTNFIDLFKFLIRFLTRVSFLNYLCLLMYNIFLRF